MDIRQIIYEQGMTVCAEAGNWRLQHLDGGKSAAIDDPLALAARYALRPVVVSGLNGNYYSELLLSPESHLTYFFVRTNEVQAALLKDAISFERGLAVVYLLNALEHHCLTLAKRYSKNCAVYASFPLIKDERSEFGHFGGDRSMYYEFDALVTCVRRTYDALRYILWSHFGDRGSCPSAFHSTYPKCQRLPDALRARLDESWTTIGNQVTDYRDCLQHYVPVSTPASTQFMRRLREGQWTGRALIPDNPEVKGRKRFTFDKMTDALTFGWNAANEVQRVAVAICEHITPDTDA